ncbi:hypothetical protein BDV95DRAFT_486598 [Massariosphaeria phaeospora]|uniref:FAD/NAD(P)-binding domain-containing protein n=1 Tax=Massariosphaeria phaeospora TaxID=100035 RepID=A0A7C8MK67_9PLEO|nr:hypothetical protein BDV95DRAFT_486598 [Massariosphaeria phaeospora]
MRPPETLDPLSSLATLSIPAPHRILIVGCAYGGISAVVNLLEYAQGKAKQIVYPGPDFKGLKSKNGIDITVIDERDGYFHSVGTPLAHVVPRHTSTMWKRFSRLNELRHPSLHFKHGSVKRIDPEAKVAEWLDRNGTLQHQAYDYVIMATGLKRHWPAVPKGGSYEEYMQDSKAFISKIVGGNTTKLQEGRKVVVIGAGAVGIEFASEIKNCYPSISVTLIHSRQQVLSSEPLPEEVKNKVKSLLEEEGVELILGNRASVKQLPNGKSEITIANGDKLTADFVIDSTTKGSPTTAFLPDACLNADKEIKVHPNLSFASDIASAASSFGVGDVIAWSGIKRAGSAMVMGQAAATNVYASILNAERTSEEDERYEHVELPSWPAVIGIAVGKQCLTYDEASGMKWGVEVMKSYFQDDLGWASNLKWLGLTDVEEVEEVIMKRPEKVQVSEVGVETVSVAA